MDHHRIDSLCADLLSEQHRCNDVMSGFEIERKFLVRGEDYRSAATSSIRIKQGYICSRGRTVRVRLCDHCGYLTIKGPADASGIKRYEFEKEITLEEAEELFKQLWNNSEDNIDGS